MWVYHAERDAEGVDDRAAEGIEGKGNGEGVPPPQTTRGSGESAVSSPIGLRGEAPTENGFNFQCIPSLKKHHLLASNYGRPA